MTTPSPPTQSLPPSSGATGLPSLRSTRPPSGLGDGGAETVEVRLLVAPDDGPAYAEATRRAVEAAGCTWTRATVPAAGVALGSGAAAATAGLVLVAPGALRVLAEGAAGGRLAGHGGVSAAALRGVLGAAPAVVGLAEEPDEPATLHAALAVGAARVLAAHDELALLETVRHARDVAVRSRTGRGPVVGIRPVTGGAGASCLAVALATRHGSPTGLVDADAGAGGDEYLLGQPWTGTSQEQVAGWHRLRALDGQVDPALLRDRLPEVDGLRVVGHGPGAREQPPDVRLRLVVEAAASAGDLVVVDLPAAGRCGHGPHGGGPSVALAPLLDVEILLVPCTVPGLAAAAGLIAAESADGPGGRPDRDERPERLMVARRAAAGLHPEEVAAALDLPLAGVVRRDARLDEHVALGLGVAPRRSSAYARCARTVRAHLAAAGVLP